jgi:hypothetical protein
VPCTKAAGLWCVIGVVGVRNARGRAKSGVAFIGSDSQDDLANDIECHALPALVPTVVGGECAQVRGVDIFLGT